MRQFLVVVPQTTLACAVLLSGCGRLTDDRVIGTWRSASGSTMELRADHTFTIVAPGDHKGSGTWRVQPKRLITTSCGDDPIKPCCSTYYDGTFSFGRLQVRLTGDDCRYDSDSTYPDTPWDTLIRVP